MEEYNVHYIIIAPNMHDDSWQVILTDRISHNSMLEAIDTDDRKAIQVALSETNIEGILAEYITREEGISIAQEYADNNVVTIYIVLPSIY